MFERSALDVSPLPRVLCVDDEPAVLDGLARSLRGQFDLTTATGGAAGLEILRDQGPFAVVLADLRMPGMDGVAFLQRARELAPRAVPVLLTGETDLHTAMGAVNEAHIFGFLSKPCRRSALLQTLQAAVAQHRLLVEDQSKQAQLEEHLRQAQKMEAIGQLAGGVAHDFNNLLTVINGFSELVLGRLAPDDPLRDPVEQIAKAGERAAQLTQQLLAFSRRQHLAPQELDPREVVVDLEKMLRRLIGEDVALAIAVQPGSGRVRVDGGQLQQVILNLVVNARDAMPGGGQITIEVAEMDLDDHYSGQHPLQPGPYVMLAVSDTGCGMDAATQARIFEPFFTTKEPGKGTGLGLSTVYGIVKQSGGDVCVSSELGKGTTFKVYLPRVRSAAAGPRSLAATLPQGSETLLVVEDAAPVRALITRVLREAGYTVLEAESGDRALAVVADHAGPIHLLLTDVIMPGLSGRDLVARLRDRRPGTRALYMSGYTGDAIIRQGLFEPGLDLLQKPFSAAALASAVRAALDAA